MRKVIFLSIFFNLFFLLSGKANLFSQLIENSNNTGKGYIISGGELSDKIGNAFKKAIHDLNEEKENRQVEVSAELSEKLKSAIMNWIADESRTRSSQVNQMVEQNWEQLLRFGPRIHYDYFLRAFDFFIRDFDIISTGSVIAPYRGLLDLREVFYVQRNYAEFNSYPKRYCYSVNIPTKIRFDYRNGEFVAGATERAQLSMEEGWPEEIFERVKLSRR